MEDDTHDKLIKAYIEYSKANEKWVRRRSYRTYYAAQRWLRKIQRLSKQLQKENLEIFNQNKYKNNT